MPSGFDITYFCNAIDRLITEFSARFDKSNMKIFQLCGQLLSDPINFSIDDLTQISANFKCELSLLQKELIELQCDPFINVYPSLISKWKNIRYPELRRSVLICIYL